MRAYCSTVERERCPWSFSSPFTCAMPLAWVCLAPACAHAQTQTDTDIDRHRQTRTFSQTTGGRESKPWSAQPKSCSGTWRSCITKGYVRHDIANRCFGAPRWGDTAQKHYAVRRVTITILENVLTESEYFIPMYYFYYLFIAYIAIATSSSATVETPTPLGTAQTRRIDEELIFALIMSS